MFFTDIYKQFLSTLKSCDFSELADELLEEELFNLIIRAIGDFRFPRVSLDYTEESPGVHRFDNPKVSQKEVNVLLALMKKYWVESVLSDDGKYGNKYFDSTLRTFSQGNILAQLNKFQKEVKTETKAAQYNYGRSDENNQPTIGKIYKW